MPITPLTPNYTKLHKKIIKCDLIKPLSETQIDELLGHSRILKLKEGETLAKLGQSASEFFLCLKGNLKLAVTSSKGQEKILHLVHPEETFAEVLMFLDHPKYPATTSALTASEVIAFPSKLYKTMLTKSINACFGLLGKYATRNLKLVNEIEALTLHNATYRVVHYLLKNLPNKVDNGVALNLSAPKHVIASRISITPETLSRILAKLKYENIIQVTDKHITVLDIDWMHTFIDKNIEH